MKYVLSVASMSDAEIFWLCPRCGSGNYHYDDIVSFPRINDDGMCWLQVIMEGSIVCDKCGWGNRE